MNVMQMAGGIGLALLIFVVVVCVLVGYICCGTMAGRLGRSVFGWVVLSLFMTPYLCMICLYAAGETNTHRMNRIMQEEEWRNKVSVKDYLGK